MYSARVLLESIDFGDIVRAQEKDNWKLVGKILAEAAGGAELLAICSAASRVQPASTLPFIHIADATAAAI